MRITQAGRDPHAPATHHGDRGLPGARTLLYARRMKPVALAAFALTALVAPAVSAQEMVVTRVLNNAPLVIESNGAPQEVRVEPRGPVVCRTPCTLHVPPGPHTVWTGGRGLRVAEVPMMVGPEGARVRVRAASRGRLVGGIILTAFGGATVLSMGALSAVAYFSAPGDEYNQMFAGIAGGMALLIGVPTLVGGIALLSGTETGVESVTPVAPAVSPQWTLGVAPLRGGALAGATITF
jgi:hypothetical protein